MSTSESSPEASWKHVSHAVSYF